MTSKTVALLMFAATTIACGGEKPAPSSSAGSGAAPAPPSWSLTVQPSAIPAAPGSSAPQLTVSEKGGPLLSWVQVGDEKSELRYVERTANGWSEARSAASGTDWFINDSDVPSVLRLSDGTLVSSWLQTTDDELEAYNLRLSYSKDDGKTWARSFLPHHDGTKTQHGFASLFEMPGQALGVVWLDGRPQAKDREKGPMTLRYAAYDGSWRQKSDAEIDAKVCECCSTSVAMTSDGAVAVFRNRTDEEIRDIYVTRLEGDKWSEGKAVHDDGWKIDACPVNGPAVSARGANVAVAWFTTRNDQGQAYLALSTDAGRTWSEPIRLDEAGTLGRVDVEMLDDGSAVASWVEFANRRGQFSVRRVERSGTRSPAVVVAGASGGRISGVPRMVRHDDQLVFAWTETPENGGIGSVKSATAALPH